MSNIYNLLDFLKEGSWEMRDGGSSTPLSTWEIGESNTLRTIAPVSMTKNNNSSSFNPSPWIYDTSSSWDGMLDFSSIAGANDRYRIKYSGTITKHPEITALRLADVYAYPEDFEDRGDHYYFETDIEQASYREVGNPEQVSLVLSFSPRGAFAGSSSIQDFEADIKIEVEISPPPPYDPPVYNGFLWWDAEGWSSFYLPEEDCASPSKVFGIIPVSGKHYIWRGTNWPDTIFDGECSNDGFSYSTEPDAIIDIPASDINVVLYEDYENYVEWGVEFWPAGMESEFDYWVLDMVADVVTEDRAYRTNIRFVGGGE